MVTITTEQIESHPHKFIEQLADGEDIVIVRENVPVARVTGLHPTSRSSLYGCLAGKMIISDDFDEPLEEFEDL